MREKIIPFEQEVLDHEMIIDEIDVLVPKYLDAVEEVEDFQKMEQLPHLLQNVGAYWGRLWDLFEEAADTGIEDVCKIDKVCQHALQAELTVLEQVYLKINLRLELDEKDWNRPLWKAADEVLDRMDTVLEGIGFDEFEEDRILIAELQAKNRAKYQKWLLSNRVLRR
jgi:hypothetical protein